MDLSGVSNEQIRNTKKISHGDKLQTLKASSMGTKEQVSVKRSLT